MRRLLTLLVLIASSLTGCAQRSARPADTSWLGRVAEVETVDVSDYVRLSSGEKARRGALADEGLRTLRLWNPRRHEGAALDFEMGVSSRDLLTLTRHRSDGIAFDKAMRVCRRAVEIDPGRTRVWAELGRVGTETGDWTRARIDLETAWDVSSRDPRARIDPVQAQRLVLDGAWLCYDQGLWEEGLAWLDRHGGAWDADCYQEGLLVRGLLQAGAGRFSEAYTCSMDLPPLRYRDTRGYARGLSTRQAGYGARWIQAMAWFHQGELDLALHALGALASARVQIPFMTRYWTDVALLHEASGDAAAARLDCALSLLGRAPMLYHMPVEGYSFPPVLFDQPDVTVPFMTLHQDRFVAGSLFGYACQMMADCSAAAADSVRMRRGGLALQAFDACRRRGDRPDLCRALRGRTLFYMGQGAAALPDLLAARDDFAAGGRVDAVTSTVIGTVLMMDDDPAGARPYLAEAVGADPDMAVAWRTYGAVLARINRHDEADAAMDRAVELDPYAVGGWYNRGLHHLNRRRFAAAQEDLLVARCLDPGNVQTERLLTTLTERWEAAEAAAARAAARADSVTAALAAGETLSVATGLDLQVERHLVDQGDTDFAARADSLSAAYAAHPDPDLRERLAEALLRADRPDEVLALLERDWLAGLGPVERRYVLQADRSLGRSARARTLATALPDDAPDVPEMEFWTLAALICLDAGARTEGLKALDHAISLAPPNTALTSFRRMISKGN